MIEQEGRCVYTIGSQCVAQSTYEIQNYKKYPDAIYEWEVVGKDVIEWWNQGQPKITVQTLSDSTSIFTVRCKITHPDFDYQNKETKDTKDVCYQNSWLDYQKWQVQDSGVVYGTYSHIRIPKQDKELCGVLREINPGSCSYELSEVCDAFSVYEVQTNNDNITYEWTSQNCEIIQGQGTKTISVKTQSNKNEKIFLRCKMDATLEGLGDLTLSGWFTHTRDMYRGGPTNPNDPTIPSNPNNPGGSSKACCYFRVQNEEGRGMDVFSPTGDWYFLSSDLFRGTCPKPPKGKMLHPETNTKDENDPNNPEPEQSCYNFKTSTTKNDIEWVAGKLIFTGGNYENFRQLDGNYTTSDVLTSCTKK